MTRSFSFIERFMTADRVKSFGIVLAALLAACVVIGIMVSFVEIARGNPLIALLFLFASVAVPLTVWLTVWHIAFSGGANERGVSEVAEQVVRISKSVEAIRKTVKAMDIGGINSSLDELKVSAAKSVSASDSKPARKPAARRSPKPSAARRAAGAGSAASSVAEQSSPSSDSEQSSS